jgi:hypothetical protein
MRSREQINLDIEAIKYEIKMARVEGNEQDVELLHEGLDELLEELHNDQTA